MGCFFRRIGFDFVSFTRDPWTAADLVHLQAVLCTAKSDAAETLTRPPGTTLIKIDRVARTQVVRLYRSDLEFGQSLFRNLRHGK